MKLYNPASFISACALITLGISGCVTDENGSTGSTTTGMTGNVKTQGVYTTLDMPDISLDMPASGYMQKSSFGPGEKPSAIVVGYGNIDQQQSVKLELIESDTGRSLITKDYYASYGRALIQPLSIRLSGNYELKLTSGGIQLDSWQFTVARTNSSGAVQVDKGNSTASYGQGLFSIYFGPDSLPDIFSKYDDTLIYSLVNAVTMESGSITNEDLFAQRLPGKVVMQWRLDFQGHLTNPKILENTLDDDCARMFQNALMGHYPYDAWPDDMRQKFGADYRYLTLTVNFD